MAETKDYGIQMPTSRGGFMFFFYVFFAVMGLISWNFGLTGAHVFLFVVSLVLLIILSMSDCPLSLIGCVGVVAITLLVLLRLTL